MDSAFTPAEVDSYSSKIDAILARNVDDIDLISAKKIRLELQNGLGRDMSHQKKTLNDLIQARFNHFLAEQEAKQARVSNGNQPSTFVKQPPSPSATSASASPVKQPVSVKRERPVESSQPTKREMSSDLSELDVTPAKKKPKKSTIDDDAAYAAKLQAQLNSDARPTRGGGPKPVRVVSKKTAKPKKKSAAKVTADDDSDVDGSSGEAEKKTNRGGAFNKPMYLSQPLQDLLGVDKLSRPQVVKGIWAHIRQHELQNPSDKRKIICDDALRNVFKKDTVDMFSMNKILSSHVSPLDD